jgi:hypothetical protein
MSLPAYVNIMTKDNIFQEASVHTGEGKEIACSKGFNPDHKDVLGVINAFNDPKGAKAVGIHFLGVKNFVQSDDGKFLYAKKVCTFQLLFFVIFERIRKDLWLFELLRS